MKRTILLFTLLFGAIDGAIGQQKGVPLTFENAIDIAMAAGVLPENIYMSFIC